MKDEFIIKYCEFHYPTETKLIARSMINYYALRNKVNKTEEESVTQDKIYAGVITLFRELSRILSNELDVEENIIFEALFVIHVKT